MKTISFQKGIPLTPFLTAAGFLAAILLVWGQLWISIYKPGDLPATAALGLIFTFLAVIVVLVAFASAGWSWLKASREENFRVTGWPVGLLVSALIMAGINVGQSLVSTAIKLYKGIPFDKPLIELATPTVRVGGIIVIFVITAFIIGMSWLGIKGNRFRNKRFWVGWLVPLIGSGVALLVLALAGKL